jgi:Fur family ferric uptake transcriptional regulator
LQSRPHLQAHESLRAIGARVTAPRVKVLAVLSSAGRALSHQEILKRAGRVRGLDRVTVYRVLEWLERQGLVHRFADDERVWRFIAGGDVAREHAHFKCERCGTVTCLDETSLARKLELPVGYRSTKIELTVRGLCSTCTPHRSHARRA